MDTIEFIALAIGSFTITVFSLILLHELGHYLTARAFGVKPKAFSIGLGPEVLGYTNANGTRLKIAAIPLGGYVSFHGEMHPGAGNLADVDHPESFARLARSKRALIIAAGPLSNVAVCFVLLGIMIALNGAQVVGADIEAVAPGGPAAAAGLRPGDRILSYDDRRYAEGLAFADYVKLRPGDRIGIVAERGGETLSRELGIETALFTDRFGNRSVIGRVGMSFRSELVTDLPASDIAWKAMQGTWRFTEMQAVGIWQMIIGKRSVTEVAGPIRLAKFTAEQVLTSWVSVVFLAALLSSALAFTNLLPVPGLDGGFLAMYAIETIRGRDLSRKTFSRAAMGGFACIAAFTLLGLANDVVSLF